MCVFITVYWSVQGKKNTSHDPCIFAAACDIFIPLSDRIFCYFPRNSIWTQQKLFQWIKNSHKNLVATKKTTTICNIFQFKVYFHCKLHVLLAKNRFSKHRIQIKEKSKRKWLKEQIPKRKCHATNVFNNLLILNSKSVVFFLSFAKYSRKLYKVIVNYVWIIEVDINWLWGCMKSRDCHNVTFGFAWLT